MIKTLAVSFTFLATTARLEVDLAYGAIFTRYSRHGYEARNAVNDASVSNISTLEMMYAATGYLHSWIYSGALGILIMI